VYGWLSSAQRYTTTEKQKRFFAEYGFALIVSDNPEWGV
jgi:hypothetical protein